jgi:membrane protein implicated in regulation of membrane protease activity
MKSFGMGAIRTTSAALAMLGVAALITAGLAALGLPVPVQLLAFTVTATIGVVLVRPIVHRRMLRPQLRVSAWRH